MHIFLLEWINISVNVTADTRVVKITRFRQFGIKRAGVWASVHLAGADRARGGRSVSVSERRQLDIPSDSNELFKTWGLSGRSGEGNKCPCVCTCAFENECLWPAQPSSPVHVCWRSVALTGSKLHLIKWYERGRGDGVCLCWNVTKT